MLYLEENIWRDFERIEFEANTDNIYCFVHERAVDL